MNIEANDLTVVIDGQKIISDVVLSCPPGRITGLVGPSGSGKTTLLHCLGLLQRPTQGQVTADGRDTRSWKDSERRRFWRDSAAFVLQDYGIMDEESVSFNVTMAMNTFGRRAAGNRPRLEAALEDTGLAGRGNEPAAHLSGGEKQRLGIARAIYKNAECLFVDEPTASLDEANRKKVIRMLADRARRGCTVIVASHDELMIGACDLRYDLERPLDL